MIEERVRGLSHENYGLAADLACVPEEIRGYGHVKEANITTAKTHEAHLLEAFRHPAPTPTATATAAE